MMKKRCYMKVCIILMLNFFGFVSFAQITGAANAVEHTLQPHPRLFFSKAEEYVILDRAKKDALLSKLLALLKKEADNDLSAAPQIYKPNVQLLAVSREQVRRLITLSMAYRLFKDNKYAKKAEEEMINVSNFPSWNPAHFLDVAEMTTAVAIGYDWCYDYLPEISRTIIEKAIREKGFGPAWPIYEKTEKTPFNRENNWNMVCNSGMLTGAIVIGDKYPTELNRILGYAVKNIPALLESFAPEGVFNEGPGYWGYNGMYMSLFFDILQRNIGNDFGLPAFKGLSNTAHFYASLIGPSGKSYNYGDAASHENIDYSGTLFYLSKLYNQPEIAGFYRNLITTAIDDYNTKNINEFTRFFFLSIPWYNPAKVSGKLKQDRLAVFNGVTDFLIFNGTKITDKNRLWLAAKTGKPSWSHNQLDVGSFVVDCDGERWGIDLGPDNYSLPNFWDYKPGGIRWNYFRNNNLSHNTISIDDKTANSDGQGELVRYNKSQAKPFGIFDLSPAYPEQVSIALRGFKLLSSDAVLIRDEVTLAPDAKKISWRFLTKADVKINGNIVTLTQNKKTFYLKCLVDEGFTLNVFPARATNPGEIPIEGVSIIEISLKPSVRNVTIPVVLGKVLPNQKVYTKENIPLNKW